MRKRKEKKNRWRRKENPGRFNKDPHPPIYKHHPQDWPNPLHHPIFMVGLIIEKRNGENHTQLFDGREKRRKGTQRQKKFFKKRERKRS